MNKNTLLIIFFIFIVTQLQAQKIKSLGSLYAYPEYKKALSNKTRSYDGRPGEKYWQNKAVYKLKVSIDPDTYEVNGAGTIDYYNNSNDSINFIVLRVYPDFYKCDALRDYPIIASDCSEKGMEIDSLFVNGVGSIFNKVGTNMVINLLSKLLPKDKVNIKIKWKYKFPKKTQIREGVFFDSSFFVAYWYPQISVYDDIYGWDFFNYTGLQEFYNDFNDFDVEVTVPDRYLVWGTGDWVNSKNILNSECLLRYEGALETDTLVSIIKDSDHQSSSIFSSNTNHTFRFKANKVPDFSFAISDSYIWDIISAKNGNSSGLKVKINLVYKSKNNDFKLLAQTAKKTVEHLSNDWPKISFPFNNLILFHGDGGMEYPMMINQGYYDHFGAASVNAHEIAHSYFPFLVGTNERRYAWMDEGWAQTLPNDCKLDIQGKTFQPQQLTKELVQYFNQFSGSSEEVPPMVPSVLLKGNSYYFSTYNRSYFALTYLKEMLGNNVFLKCLREYISRWKEKHPSPYDFFCTFNNISKKDLDWYWKAWYFEFGHADVSVNSIIDKKDFYDITITKRGVLPVPIKCEVVYENGLTQNFYENAYIWHNKNDHHILILKKRNKIKSVRLDTNLIPDADSSNNVIILRK